MSFLTPLDDARIDALAPSVKAPSLSAPDLDARTRQQFRSVYRPLRDKGVHPFHLHRLATGLSQLRPLLERLGLADRNATLVEIGSEHGMKSLAVGDLFGRHVGIDLDPANVDRAREHRRMVSGTAAIEFVVGNGVEALTHPGRFGLPDRIDVLLLYAVLEHLTLPERRELLGHAREIIDRGGAVIIAETPNRLCRFDAHSWQLDFMNWLPWELAAEYSDRSSREDLRWHLGRTPAAGRGEQMHRLGRGLSYHEFELYLFGREMRDLPILADGFAPEFLSIVPLHNQELEIQRWFDVDRVPVHKCFTRYWLEMVCSRRGARTTGPSVRYLAPGESNHAAEVHAWPQHWAIAEVQIGSGPPLIVEHGLREAARLTVQLSLDRSAGAFSIELENATQVAELDIEALRNGRLPDWHTQAALTFDLPADAGRSIIFRPSRAGSNLCYQGTIVEPLPRG